MIEAQLLKEIEDKIKNLTKLKEEVKGDAIFVCEKCKYREPIKKLTCYEITYYVEPHGCTGGDYYTTCGYEVVCSNCKERNFFSKEFIFYSYFKEVIEEER
jgi:hypothetical protein